MVDISRKMYLPSTSITRGKRHFLSKLEDNHFHVIILYLDCSNMWCYSHECYMFLERSIEPFLHRFYSLTFMN